MDFIISFQFFRFLAAMKEIFLEIKIMCRKNYSVKKAFIKIHSSGKGGAIL